LAPMAEGAVHAGELLAFVEIPKGSRNKYEFDERIGHVILDRFLSSSMVYPTDYGYLIGHRGRDGDPLDAMVCVSEPTFPGCVIPVRTVAVLRMTDDKGQDDKVICVPESDPAWDEVEDLDDLPAQLRVEIEHFFSIYKQPEGKDVTIDGWFGREDALATIADSRERYESSGAARSA